MKRFLIWFSMVALGTVFLVGARHRDPNDVHIAERPEVVPLPGFDFDGPVTVLVRGWLWDPSSRAEAGPLTDFPRRVSQKLDQRYGLSASFYQFDWSRIPVQLPNFSNKFTSFARSLSQKGAESGRCINFVGHSAGAAMVYFAAAHDVRMGFMGTLGLPTIGSGKPKLVDYWANFYTSTHFDDIAGRWWAPDMRADENVDLEMPHKDFWDSETAAAVTASGIARAWEDCRA